MGGDPRLLRQRIVLVLGSLALSLVIGGTYAEGKSKVEIVPQLSGAVASVVEIFR